MGLGNFVVKHKLAIIIVFVIAIIVSVVCVFFVNVNYDSSQYMPEDSDLRKGMDIMYSEFDGNSMAQVMVKDLTYQDALALKKQIEAVNGVASVIWLDTMVSKIVNESLPLFIKRKVDTNAAEITQFMLSYAKAIPEDKEINRKLLPHFVSIILSGELKIDINSISDMQAQLKDYYKNNSALMQVLFTDTDYSELTFQAVEKIRALEYKVHMLGNPAMVYNSRVTVDKQTLIALGIAALILIIILFITSSSYFEPVIFMATIGIAVLLNMGTNILLPSISYMTKSVASVLQLALTMDYSIFLLHRYKQEQKLGVSNKDAMAAAIKHSLSPISASSMTTILSFVAIMFMSYSIGFDLGFVLAKGVLFSVLSVFFLLPNLILMTNKLIAKSEHKTFTLNFKKHSTFLLKTRKFLPILVILIVIPCIYMQSANTFVYGNGATFGGESSIIYDDRLVIENTFGTQNQIALLIPSRYADKEAKLTMAINNLDGVKSAQGLAVIEEAGLVGMMPPEILGQFVAKSGNYRRIVIFLNVPEESAETTAVLNNLITVINQHLEGDYYLVGESSSVLEIKEVVDKDFTLITILSILLVGLVIAVAFKSLSIPVILVLIIQSSIWMAMSIPFMAGTPMVFLGYLMVSAILLGTTIDYAILYANNYAAARRTENKDQALRLAIAGSSKTIVTSASIFTLIGFAVSAVSSMPAIQLFGSSIGFGGLTSMLMVLILLPQALYLLDKPSQYLTRHARKTYYNAIEPPQLKGEDIDNDTALQSNSDTLSADALADNSISDNEVDSTNNDNR